MKASQVLEKYQNEERNFQGLNLRGENFAGKNLSGANFSYCQIQGANFQEANLTGANFTGAKAGIKLSWLLILIIISLVLSIFAGFTSSILFTFLSYLLTGEKPNFVVMAISSTFFINTIRIVLEENNDYFKNLIDQFAPFLSFDSIVRLQIYVAIMIIIAIAFVGVLVAVIDEPQPQAKMGSIYIITGLLIIILLLTLFPEQTPSGLTIGEFIGGPIGAILGTWFSHIAILGKPQFHWLWKVYLELAIVGGTHFNHAKLEDTNFERAILKGTDLKDANIIRTKFINTAFDTTRCARTILANPKVRDLLTNPSNGYHIDLRKANLRGANLENADLEEANLSQTDISEATLKYANLKDANLTEVNAIKTNFSNATLTGTCLENWNIDDNTILDNVICKYVYLLKDKQERRPSNGEFEGDEFTTLFRKVFHTVDLIFRDGIDWKALVFAIKEVQKKNKDTTLKVQTIENKQHKVFVIKVLVPPNADKPEIYKQLVEKYEAEKKELEAEYKKELAVQNQQIESYQRENTNLMKIIEIQADNSRLINHITQTNQTHSGEGDNVGNDKNEYNNS